MKPLVELNSVSFAYPSKRRGVAPVQALSKVSLAIGEGEAVGLVGESGSGKSTTGRVICGLLEPADGSINFGGSPYDSRSRSGSKRLRHGIQMLWQDPYGSLNPRFTVLDVIAEPLRIRGLQKSDGGERQVRELLEQVGLDPSFRFKYPHQCSGGQRQRIAIARALAVRPRLLVLDEPVSALDVSVQAHIINLLQDLRDRFGLAYLFISHDLAVVRYVCERVSVMYLGEVVESGETSQILTAPNHPYSAALLSAVPTTTRRATERIVLQGDTPSPSSPPSGCRFHTRCWKATDVCRSLPPEPVPVAGATVACHHPMSSALSR
ncbi:ABC transporter ATP-binding protein [Acrocarpospora pleiomorpha]|uniref:ABC transporter ATP-binding protein n=1 Tax=Acrocarpospora pleiomorpha TaxID=90975 RepID=A0A5M3X9C4_9ACTN|nr:ABC transporter ATP-binding protein [Acrocarpospora pleiomorpha]